MRVLGQILLFFLVIWALAVSVLSFFGLTVIFPWKITETGEIPQLRAEVARISIFLTFVHYGVLHLFGKTREYLPIHFLSCYLLYLLITSIILLFLRDFGVTDFLALVFFLVCYLSISILTKPKIRDYLRKQ